MLFSVHGGGDWPALPARPRQLRPGRLGDHRPARRSRGSGREPVPGDQLAAPRRPVAGPGLALGRWLGGCCSQLDAGPGSGLPVCGVPGGQASDEFLSVAGSRCGQLAEQALGLGLSIGGPTGRPPVRRLPERLGRPAAAIASGRPIGLSVPGSTSHLGGHLAPGQLPGLARPGPGIRGSRSRTPPGNRCMTAQYQALTQPASWRIRVRGAALHLSPAVGELTACIQLRTRPTSPDFGPLVHCLATIRP